jgi:hypothetical protein
MACDGSCGFRQPAIDDVGRRHRGVDNPTRRPRAERLKETDLIERIRFAQRSVKAVNFENEPRFSGGAKSLGGTEVARPIRETPSTGSGPPFSQSLSKARIRIVERRGGTRKGVTNLCRLW